PDRGRHGGGHLMPRRRRPAPTILDRGRQALSWGVRLVTETLGLLGTLVGAAVLKGLYSAAPALVLGLVKASGITVRTGHHALKFTCGRVAKVLEPGFHPLIPGLQVARQVPTRARTLDLEAQRVVTDEGYVFEADATVTWRITDVTLAL